jgi:hypothetical protein
MSTIVLRPRQWRFPRVGKQTLAGSSDARGRLTPHRLPLLLKMGAGVLIIIWLLTAVWVAPVF